MAGRNGTSARRVYRAIPHTSTLVVEVLRGGKPTEIEVTGYHRDNPEAWNQIDAEAAWDAWRAAVYVPNTEGVTETDPETGEVTTPETIYRDNPAAEVALRRDMLLAVVKGLEEQDAYVMARDGGDWFPILQDLGWWGTPTEEASGDPEAVGEAADPTGSASSPDSTVPGPVLTSST